MVDKIIIEICSTICIKGYIILESYKCLLLKSNRCPHDGLSKFVLKRFELLCEILNILKHLKDLKFWLPFISVCRLTSESPYNKPISCV